MSETPPPNKRQVIYIDCMAHDNAGSGYHFGKGVSATVINSSAFGNGLNGFTIVGDEDESIQHLRDVLSELNSSIKDWELTVQDMEELQLDINTIEKRLISENPNKIIIAESLKSLRNITESFASSTLFMGINMAINNFS